MMRSPGLMLAREIWWRNRKFACLSVGALPAFFLFDCAIRSQVHTLAAREGFACLWMLFSLFWVFATFNYTEVDRRKGWTGFPHRLFVLPVSTLALVSWPMLLASVSVAFVFMVWAKLLFAPLGMYLPLELAAWWVAAIACFQAVLWSLASLRLTRLFFLSIGGLLFIFVGGFHFAMRLHEEQVANARFCERMFTLSYLGLTVLAFLTAWFSVARQRRGGGRARGKLKAVIWRAPAWVMDRLPGVRKPFAGPLSAQAWFEWRRGGMLLPLSVGGSLALLLGPISWLNRTQMTPERTVWIVLLMLLMPLLLAFVIGKGFAQPDFWSSDKALPTFLAIRPLSAWEFVTTKLRVAACSTLLSWLLVLAAVPIWLALWGDTTQFREIWNRLREHLGAFPLGALVLLALVTGLVLTWRGMVGDLWVGLSGSSKWSNFSGILHGAGMIALIMASILAREVPAAVLVRRTAWMLAVMIFAKLWLAVFAWDNVSRRHDCSRGVATYLLIWAGSTLLMVMLSCLAFSNDQWMGYLAALAALFAFPLARPALAPLSLARNRHR